MIKYRQSGNRVYYVLYDQDGNKVTEVNDTVEVFRALRRQMTEEEFVELPNTEPLL